MYITDQEEARSESLNENAPLVRATRQKNYASVTSPYRQVEQRDKRKQMNRMVMMPLQLLYLPKQQRLLLILGMLILSLGSGWLVFPQFLGVVLLLPIL